MYTTHCWFCWSKLISLKHGDASHSNHMKLLHDTDNIPVDVASHFTSFAFNAKLIWSLWKELRDSGFQWGKKNLLLPAQHLLLWYEDKKADKVFWHTLLLYLKSLTSQQISPRHKPFPVKCSYFECAFSVIVCYRDLQQAACHRHSWGGGNKRQKADTRTDKQQQSPFFSSPQ